MKPLPFRKAQISVIGRIRDRYRSEVAKGARRSSALEDNATTAACPVPKCDGNINRGLPETDIASIGTPAALGTALAAACILLGLCLSTISALAAECKPTISGLGEQRVHSLQHLYRGKPFEVVSQAARNRAKEAAWSSWSALATGLYGSAYAFEGNARDPRVSCSEVTPESATGYAAWYQKRWQCRVWGKPCNG